MYIACIDVEEDGDQSWNFLAKMLHREDTKSWTGLWLVKQTKGPLDMGNSEQTIHLNCV